MVGLWCIMASGCASGGPYRSETYVVGPHDTLYSVAWRHDLDYRNLAKWNGLGTDYALRVGQVLILRPSGPAAASPRRTAPPVGAGANRIPAPAGGNTKWAWPTDPSSMPQPVPGGGILLSGGLGQDVRAAAAGRVVYTGSGLRGYGNLIIIKHGDTLLTSYAHNRELLVREGQDVAAGQTIAHMGLGPHQISALYFEIRVNGKPVDPLRYLPARPP